ncbi:restriction endonuclease subunit S [Vibrio sinaloensis]|uniref:restriction endonuclease subunit S n=1 Tax=Photobacterium sp. (strain ATCC 43367) TaxID=379097 RepID=UPI0035EBAD46
MTWKMESISDLCIFAIDCVNKTAPVVDYETPYKMIRTTNVKGGFIDLDTVRYVEEETFLKWTRRSKPQYGDVIFTREAPVGDVGRFTSKDPNVFLGQRLFHYRPNPELLDWRYLAYVLQSEAIQGWVHGIAFGATVPHIKVADAENLKIPCPPISIQRKIGVVLSAYDDLIENNLERVKLLEEMAQITYGEWFVRMKFPGYEEVELDLETGLPIGWKTQTLRELTSYINRGVAPKYVESEGFPVINQKCIRGHLVNFTESRLTVSDHKVPKDKLLQSLDILVNSTGTGTLGRVAQLFDCPDKATVDTHVTIVRPSGDVSAYWLGRSLEAIEPFIVNLGKGATNQQELGRNDLADIVKLNTPTEDLMARFDDFARPIFETITNLLNQNGLLKEARDILLPRLMTGMIDIDKVELPAALLERINKQKNNETNIG